MNKKRWMIPLSALLMIGVAGCANNNRAGVNESNNNPLRPVGYYSNENHPNNGNALVRDNDGAITEMLDHTLGDEDVVLNEQTRRQSQIRDKNGNPINPTKPLAAKDRFFQRDDRFSTSDMNYHGHLSKNIRNTGVVTDPNFQDRVSNTIRNKVAGMNNVQVVRSVAYGNTVTISVTLVDKGKAADTKKAIRNAVKPYANGRTVTVLTDEGTLSRDRNINNDIQLNRGGK